MNKTLVVATVLFTAAFTIGIALGVRTGTAILEQRCVDGLHWDNNGHSFHCIAF